MATVYLIQRYNRSSDEFDESISACTSRKDAEFRCKNLNSNFPDFKHEIKPITLNGVVKSQMENNCYIFGINEK